MINLVTKLWLLYLQPVWTLYFLMGLKLWYTTQYRKDLPFLVVATSLLGEFMRTILGILDNS